MHKVAWELGLVRRDARADHGSARRILPRASDLRVQATLDYKQRLQQLFFPEGVAFDGNRFNSWWDANKR
jgi:hypothetical protein